MKRKKETARAYGLVASLLGIAACAMVYQFSVITSLAFILGERIYLYATFTGCFLIAVGIGASIAMPKKSTKKIGLVKTQFVLSLLGVLGLPVLIFLFSVSEYAQRQGLGIPYWAHVAFLWTIGLTSVFLIGYFCGRQIPHLAQVLRDFHFTEHPLKLLLGFDYLGFLLGAALFPLFLFPSLGLFRSFFLATLASGFLSLATYSLLGLRMPRQLWLTTVVLAMGLTGFLVATHIETGLNAIVYGP